MLALGRPFWAGQEEDLRRLFERLGSDEIETRESASQGLLQGGARTLEVMGKGPLPADAETAARLREISRQIVERCVRSEWNEQMASPVTMSVKGGPARGLVEELRKHTPLKIELDERNFSDDLEVEAVSYSAVPLAKALDRILERTGSIILRRDASGVRIGRPDRLSFQFKRVDARTLFRTVSGTCGVEILLDPGIEGALDYNAQYAAWSTIVDDVSAKSGWVALRTKEKEIVVRRKVDYEKDVKTRPFPLKHLHPEDPKKGHPSRFSALLWTVEGALTRGAGWDTLHGKVDYDPWKRAVVVTDREDVLDAVSKLVEKNDRPE